MSRARDAVAELSLDALLVTKLDHVRYLTGFTGSAALLLLRPTGTLFVTDGRYRDQAADELARAGTSGSDGGVDDLAVVTSRDEEQQLVSAASGGLVRIGLEAADVSWARQRDLAERWFPDCELVPTEGLVEAQREVKEPGEVARIEAAAAIADAALAAAVAHLHEEPTEAEVALELEAAMRRLGAERAAFETIVASGPNAALPHAHPGLRRVREGDLVVLDFGAVCEGYHSDMTRTVCVGQPTADQQRLYDVVGAAHDAARAVARAGAEASSVDGAARAVIEEAGWGAAFSHGTGHGVGLEIHEAPYVGRTSTATIRPGSVITIEPGVYLPGLGGVRTEDTLLVDAGGCRALTRSPKNLAS
ncbi:MAG: M24 family metallopeptidase [Acidimicrobiia bacterium]|nr:M24 family metallopeptidase [Acidimicrobiia bacterium]